MIWPGPGPGPIGGSGQVWVIGAVRTAVELDYVSVRETPITRAGVAKPVIMANPAVSVITGLVPGTSDT